MEQKPKLMTPFDMLVTSSSLYTLKLMLPFAPASMQRSLAIYIKFSELKATMEHFYGFLNTDHPIPVPRLEPTTEDEAAEWEEAKRRRELRKSKEEQAQIDRMVRMVSGYAKRAGK